MNSNGPFGRMLQFVMKFNPTMLIYRPAFTRRILFQVVKLYSFVYLVGLFRKPYIKAQLLSKQEAEKQVQESQVSEMLSKIDIKLSAYPQDYFVIVSASANIENDQQVRDKQKTLFDFNDQINKKLEINRQYFNDVKFLFVGGEDIYKIVQVNNTIVEFYEKEEQRKTEPAVYIMARDASGQEKLLTSLPFRADLKSILNIISKQKARRFADSMQF